MSLLITLFFLGLFSAKAYDFFQNGVYYSITGENEVAVTFGFQSKYEGNVVVPPSVDYLGVTYSVTGIGKSAFGFCYNLSSVTLPGTITSIGDEAFLFCSLLKTFTIPESVTRIGKQAFSGCESLSTIAIPESVMSIDTAAFWGCSSMEEFVVSDQNRYYSSRDGVLYDKEQTVLWVCPIAKTSITIPNTVTSIKEYAFANSLGLTTIFIPESVTSIGDDAFKSCWNLEEFVVSDQNRYYSSRDGILYDKAQTKLWVCPVKKTSATIPQTVTSIEKSAFEFCRDLTSITIPDRVTRIGELAFESCSSLQSVTIPESVTSIGASAFMYCTNLMEIAIPEWVTSIEDNTFCGCSSLSSVTIPESVTSIGSSAFMNCTDLTEIAIPEWVTRIGASAFSGCTGLTTLNIPRSVTCIEKSTFSDCESLTAVTIPESVTTIGASAFLDCEGLMSVIIPHSVTDIGYKAFEHCEHLTAITIPESVTSMGDYAFFGCIRLESITSLAVTPPEIGEHTFDSYRSPLYVPAGKKEVYKGAEYWKEFVNIVELPSSMESAESSRVDICVVGRTLHIENEEQVYRVYNTEGRAVYTGNASTVSLTPGVYVVCTRGCTQKVMVK